MGRSLTLFPFQCFLVLGWLEGRRAPAGNNPSNRLFLQVWSSPLTSHEVEGRPQSTSDQPTQGSAQEIAVTTFPLPCLYTYIHPSLPFVGPSPPQLSRYNLWK